MYASSEKKENLCDTRHGALVLVANLYASTRQDLLGDGLGSVRSISDSSGAVVGSADYTLLGEYRNQTGVTRPGAPWAGFTGEYYAEETGMWHLRARDLHPSLGRFLSADPVQPCPEGSHPGTHGYNRYAYVANNPTTWVDPSGYSVNDPLADNDASLLALMTASGFGNNGVFLQYALIVLCGLQENCINNGYLGLIDQLGADTYNALAWSAEGLYNVFLSTYPHQPTPVSPAALVFSLTVSNMFIVGDLYDLVTAVTGYDIITGQYLAGWERLVTLIGVIPIPGVSGGSLRHGVDAVDSFAGHGDDLARVVGGVSDVCHINSFSEETPVVTDEGAIPIKDVDVGDRVLAWDELTETTDYYLVTAAFSHVDATIVELTIDGDPSASAGTETIETTADHPFYVVVGDADGRWVEAGELAVGDAVQKADGTTGMVEAVVVVAMPQRMYILTVADAHTFFVGDDSK